MAGDVRRRRQRDLLEGGPGGPLDLDEPAPLARGEERQRGAGAAGAAGAADAVDVGVVLAGHVEVDHEADALDVEAAGRDVGGHEDVEGAGPQPLDELLALLLRHVAGQGGGLDALGGQLERDLLGGALGAHEDDGGVGLGGGEHTAQRADLVLERHDGVGLVHRGDGGRRPGDGDAHRVVEVRGRDLLDAVWHRRGEQRGAARGRDVPGDDLDVLGEAHAEHLVRLIHDEEAHAGQVQAAALDEVHDAARRPDDDLGAVLEGAQLRDVARPAVDRQHDEVAGAVSEGRDGVGHLHGELAGGGEDQGLHGAPGRVDLGEEWQAEGGRLPGAGLGDADDVAAAEQDGDRLGLDVRGGGEAQVGDGGEQVGRQAEVGEGHGVVGGGCVVGRSGRLLGGSGPSRRRERARRRPRRRTCTPPGRRRGRRRRRSWAWQSQGQGWSRKQTHRQRSAGELARLATHHPREGPHHATLPHGAWAVSFTPGATRVSVGPCSWRGEAR